MPIQKSALIASALVAATLSPALVPSAPGAVLCQKPSGVVVVRAACKKKETALDLAQFGAVGPKGDSGDPGPAGPAGSIEGAPAGGDLSGSYPAPTIAAASAPTVVAENPGTATDPCAGPTPQTGVYCGTTSVRWLADPGVFSESGIEFWHDRLGAIHVRGSALIFGTGDVETLPLFYLPVGARPAKIQGFPVGITNSGVGSAVSAFLFVYPDGRLSVFNAEADAQTAIILGEIQFRTDS